MRYVVVFNDNDGTHIRSDLNISQAMDVMLSIRNGMKCDIDSDYKGDDKIWSAKLYIIDFLDGAYNLNLTYDTLLWSFWNDIDKITDMFCDEYFTERLVK